MEKKLISWSLQNYSLLPWRVERSLYRTLVSEIMLQQTTVGTVLKHFEDFMLKYPTIFKLGQVTEEQICIAWKGLGYYRRARNLRLAAIDICEKYNGIIPTCYDSLLKIAGIGPYTANAILGIGHNQRALAVDGNLERVISRYFWIEKEKGNKLQREIYALFAKKKIFSPQKNIHYRPLNEALMDLGRVLCQSKKTSCTICPIKKGCHAYKKKQPLVLPFLGHKKAKEKQHQLELLRVVIREQGKLFMVKRQKKQWLEGQLECPTFILNSSDQNLSQYPLLTINRKEFTRCLSLKSSITKYSINNKFFEISKKEFNKKFSDFSGNLIAIEDKNNLLKKKNLSTVTLKILTKLKEQEYA